VLDQRDHWLSRSRPGFPVSGEPLGPSPSTVPRVSCEMRVHPLVSFRSPAESLPLRAPFTPAGVVKEPSLGSRSLLATSTSGVHSRGIPRSHEVPSPAFCTPSTVCSATGLAGLFHPAAASRVRSSGGFPPAKPYRLVDGPYPHAVSADPLPDGCPPCAAGRRPAYRACSSPGPVAT